MNRFDYTISNPPYQQDKSNTHNNFAINIFHHFYDTGSKISHKTTMIFPGGRWMQRSSKAGKIADLIYPTITSVEWFPNSGRIKNKVFPYVDLPDGVCIVLGDHNHSDTMTLNGIMLDKPGKREIVPLTRTGALLVKKISEQYDSSISKRKTGSMIFGLRTFWVERNKEKVSKEKNNIVNPVKAWLANDGRGITKKVDSYWISESVVSWSDESKNIYGKYKICSTKEAGAKPDEVKYRFVDNNTVIGESWTIFGCFDTKEEALNYQQYLSTDIVKLLLGESKGGKSRTWGYFVPDLGDYSNDNPDIEWSKPLDPQLHKLFNLSEEEISMISNHD